ncbi:MAG: CpaF family protein [Methylococcales bacterium]|nr:CpaF family protein [Methylococcales bacterium]MDD5630666.1 CpaF family protein [Methylococcales bacterium]
MSLKSRIQDYTNKAINPIPSKSASLADSNVHPDRPAIPPLTFDLLSAKDLEYQEKVRRKLMEILDLSLIVNMASEDARIQISEIARRVIDEEAIPVNARSRQLIVNEVVNDILGFGPLEHLLYEPTIADILVNGCNSVFIERFGKLEKTPITFKDDAHLLKIIDRIVTLVGRRIDESSPLVDARLKDGSRVNAIIPPLAIDGPSLSIRRFSQDKMKLQDMVNIGTLSQAMADVFANMVKVKLNILISGGTGSGKTTLLNALSNHIPNTERVVTIEDSAELQLKIDNLVRLETRPPNMEGKGEVTQRDLVKNSLRMRPDRIVIGEVRGQEAFDMLQAMNTGHDGSLTTIHANNTRDALSRVENMVTMAGFDLPARTIRSQIASAINVVLQLERMEDGKRRVTSVSEINNMEGDIITMSEIFKFERRGVDEAGNITGRFMSMGIVPRFHERMKQRGINIGLDLYIDQTTGSL